MRSLFVCTDYNWGKGQFSASKNKVAPLKELSIASLELLGCVLLTKLVKDIRLAVDKRLPINKVICLTDSEVFLCWIKGKEKSWKPWMENRVTSIRKIVDRECWNHVLGSVNKADIPTKV